ncbi:addiction module protein [Sorangium sp. So ce854]|uniref:addiction module protein n=1 Tax=Sorangium sp. So ce854 TaxID=3133322 RepID=UPI003F6194D3
MHGRRDPRPLDRESPRGEDGHRSALLTAAVAAALIQSLDEPEQSTEEVEVAWAEEIQQRLADVDAGVVTPVPWPEARRRILAAANGRREAPRSPASRTRGSRRGYGVVRGTGSTRSGAVRRRDRGGIEPNCGGAGPLALYPSRDASGAFDTVSLSRRVPRRANAHSRRGHRTPKAEAGLLE